MLEFAIVAAWAEEHLGTWGTEKAEPTRKGQGQSQQRRRDTAPGAMPRRPLHMVLREGMGQCGFYFADVQRTDCGRKEGAENPVRRPCHGGGAGEWARPPDGGAGAAGWWCRTRRA